MTAGWTSAVVEDSRTVVAGDGHSAAREAELRASSSVNDDATLLTRFSVPEIHCASCINRIEGDLSAIPGVAQVRANLSSKTVSVTWNPDTGSATAIAKRLSELGFNFVVAGDVSSQEAAAQSYGRRLLLSIAVSGFASANIMLLSVSVWSGASGETGTLFHLISGLIAVPAVAYAAQPFFRSAVGSLRNGRLNMDVPISLAIVLSLALSLYESLIGGGPAYYDAAVMLTFFLLIGRYLDYLMREKARGALHSLASLSAKGATLIEPGTPDRYVELRDIKPSMHLRVMAGDRLPVNGRVMNGQGLVDRSLVTGESAPVHCSAGDDLEAGVLNVSGPLDIEATSTSSTSFLAEITRMMDATEQGRGYYVRLADRAARIYAPAVHLAALLAFAGWMVFSGDWHLSITIAIAVLIITCPCALGLAVPIVHVLGARRLLNEGVLMRDGSALERLAEIDTIVFDKTGTLTCGKPAVTGVSNFNVSDAPLIAALASRSNHPAAYAVKQYVKGATTALTDVTELPGKGVEGFWQGVRIRLGRASWVQEISRSMDGDGSGSSVWFARKDTLATCFRIADTLRPRAVETAETLRGSGLELEILSGDVAEVVRDVAQRLGIERYEHQLTPQQKIARIEELKLQGHNALMVGDGLNDAPALAAGHVSMAPSTASDIGRTAADFVFTDNSLSAVAFTCDLALAAKRLVKQNFAIALVYNAVAIPLAVAGYVTPLIAALAMSGSSIAVLANSMRLNHQSFGQNDKEAISEKSGQKIFPHINERFAG